jgi:trehalose synthase
LAEGFGLTVTEAMYKGTPVVASAVGGISDQIVDDESGLLVKDPRNLDEYGAAVNRILDDPQLAARLGEGGRRRAIDAFLPDTSLGQWEELLVAVITPEA